MEGDVAGVLAVRGVDETDLRAVGEQANGNAGFAEQALEALRGRRGPAAFVGGSAGVEVGGEGKHFGQEKPRGSGVLECWSVGVLGVGEGERTG